MREVPNRQLQDEEGKEGSPRSQRKARESRDRRGKVTRQRELRVTGSKSWTYCWHRWLALRAQPVP